MKFQLNDKEAIKDLLSSRAWELIQQYCEEVEQDLEAGILSSYNEDMSKTIYNKRDMWLKEYDDFEKFVNIPEYILTRISNESDILE